MYKLCFLIDSFDRSSYFFRVAVVDGACGCGVRLVMVCVYIYISMKMTLLCATISDDIRYDDR